MIGGFTLDKDLIIREIYKLVNKKLYDDNIITYKEYYLLLSKLSKGIK